MKNRKKHTEELRNKIRVQGIELVKYGLVAAGGAIVSIGVYLGIVAINKRLYMLAYGVCFAVSVLMMYALNHRFVFVKTQQGHAKPIAKAYISNATVFLVGWVSLWMLVEKFEVSETLAPLLNLFLTAPLNFLLNKFWTFR